MIEKEVLAEVLELASRNGNFAEIYMERSAQNRVSMEAGKIERVISGRAGIRGVKGENTAYGYTTDLARDGLLELANRVAIGTGGSAQSIQTGQTGSKSITFQKRESPVILPVNQRLDQVGIDEKVALVKEAEKAARAKDEKLICQVSSKLGEKSALLATVPGSTRLLSKTDECDCDTPFIL
jgi:TldD protein